MRPSPAMVVALIALFVALGGVSYGIATGSIGSREIRDGTVQSRDVRNDSLSGVDVENNSLGGGDIAAGTIRGRDVAAGAIRSREISDRSIFSRDVASNSLGDREIDEPQLEVNRLGGVPSRRYIRNVQNVQTATGSDPVTPKAAPPARCPAGKRLIGGGASVVAPAPVPVALSANGPSGNAWAAIAYATAPTGNWQLVAVAICG
jgi:hypothetical protein